MRFISLPLPCALLVFLVSGCATSSQQAKLAQEVQQLQKDFEGFKAEVKTFQKVSTHSSSGAKNPNLEKLAKIEFPKDPSSENLKHYINEILVSSQGQTSVSLQDTQTAMLARVGSDNIQLLIDAMPEGSQSSGMGNYHLDYAIKMLAEDKHQSLILKALPTKQRLVSVVTQMHWEKEARDILLAELQGSNGAYLPTDWIKAVVFLQDPKTYDALTDYFSKAQNPSYVYQAIYLLPSIKLDDAVEKAWAKAKCSSSDYMIAGMAPIAGSFGHQDAIEALIAQLKKPQGGMFSSSNPRLALLMLLDASGSNEEIAAWYAANKNNLIFDPESKKFKLKK